VKVTVIGRPTQVVERQGVVVVALRSTKLPTLPKGLPPLPATPTMYMLFIQQKQWNKVREAIQNADDVLIVEGYPVHEPRFAGITVYATQVTTKALQVAKRKQQVASVSEG
jgi:predicted GTPase